MHLRFAPKAVVQGGHHRLIGRGVRQIEAGGGNRNRPRRRAKHDYVWLDASLIAEYRDWSWDARCQLSTLVEEALLAYRNRRENRNSVPR
jgi:hypothetical protein